MILQLTGKQKAGLKNKWGGLNLYNTECPPPGFLWIAIESITDIIRWLENYAQIKVIIAATAVNTRDIITAVLMTLASMPRASIVAAAF